MIRLSVLFLLIALACGNSLDDCSVKNSCFGTPEKCRPGIDCRVYFHFDRNGNLDVYIKNIVDQDGYVSFSVYTFPIYDHFICIPHLYKRLRAVSGERTPIQIVNQNMTQRVKKLSDNDFVCTFLESDFPYAFNNRTKYIVSEGHFAEDMVIPLGSELFAIDIEDVAVDFLDSDNKSSASFHHKRESPSHQYREESNNGIQDDKNVDFDDYTPKEKSDTPLVHSEFGYGDDFEDDDNVNHEQRHKRTPENDKKH